MSSSTSSSSPCAACKFLRRKCTLTCVFAPYFPPDQPSKFANVHRVFGASNVAKLLADLPHVHREDAVNSLAYEANARLRDPVYGCIGEISQMQQRMKRLQVDLLNAKKELAQYIGGTNTLPPQFITGGGVGINNHHQNQIQIIQQHGFHGGVVPASGIGVPQSLQPQSRILLLDQQQQQQQQLMEAMHMANAAAREQELFRGFDQQQQHHHHQIDEYARYSTVAAVGVEGEANRDFNNQMGNVRVLTVAGEQQSELGLVPQGYDNTFQLQQHQQQLQQQQNLICYREQQGQQKVECEEEHVQQRHRPPLPHHQRTGSDKDRSCSGGSVLGPSC